MDGWRDVTMGMFTTAFDAAGHESDQLILAVCGFVSSANHWISFSEKWKERLARDRITYFHAVEFAHSVKQFEGWREQKARREALSADLMTLVKSHAYRKLGIVVTNKTFKDIVSAETKEEWHLNAYSLAGRTCAKQVGEWAKTERITSPIEYVFVEGDVGADKLSKRMIEDGNPAPHFRPKKDRVTPRGVLVPAFIPLQAADFLAYEVFLEVDRVKKSDPHPPRWGLLEFDRMLGDIGTYEVEGLKQMQDMMELTDTLNEWAISTGILKPSQKKP